MRFLPSSVRHDPTHPRVKPLDRRIADFDFLECVLRCYHIRLRVAHGLRMLSKIALIRFREQRCGGEGSECGEEGTAGGVLGPFLSRARAGGQTAGGILVLILIVIIIVILPRMSPVL